MTSDPPYVMRVAGLLVFLPFASPDDMLSVYPVLQIIGRQLTEAYPFTHVSLMGCGAPHAIIRVGGKDLMSGSEKEEVRRFVQGVIEGVVNSDAVWQV